MKSQLVRLLPAFLILTLAVSGIKSALADHTDDPASVSIVGNLQSELGCPGDWQPDCIATQIGYDGDDDVWQGLFAVPAGNWEYKAALNGSWAENYGAGGVHDGPNIPLDLGATTDVKFYYDHKSHWITDNVNSVIATAVGSFQSELGCLDDWQPWCLRSWMQDLDGDGTYTYSTNAIPAGDYEFKVALDEDWSTSFPGGNVPFTVANTGDLITFTYNSATNDVSIEVSGGSEPGDELLVRPSVRVPAQDNIFYFVLPDRFDNGDPGNDAGGDTSGDPLVNGLLPTDKGYYHGGDLAGLTARLPYLNNLGVNAIWLTPQFTNRWVQGDSTIGGSTAGYHGYWQIDYSQIDPHFGSNAEMQAFVSAAHGLGIEVFFDIVANHTGDIITSAEGGNDYFSKDENPYRDATNVPFDDRDYAGTGTFPDLDPAISFPYTPALAPGDEMVKSPAWLNNPIYYHNRGDSTFSGESSLYGDFFGLDDLFTEHHVVQDGLIDIYKDMITTFDIDGFRIDTVKHVNDEFWESFGPEIDAYAQAQGKTDFFFFGEVFDGNPANTSRFTTELPLHAVLDFGFQGSALNFASQSGATDNLRNFYENDDYYTDSDSNAYALPTFLGNHDNGRLGFFLQQDNPGASDAELVARDQLAHALMYFGRGIPVVYYGDEQGFTGDGGDRDARQDMMPSVVPSYNDDDLIGTSATTADDNFDDTHPLYQVLADFAALVDAHPALRQGAQIHRYSEPNAGIYAFSRIERAEQVEYVVALNNATAVDSATFGTGSPGGTTFTELWPGGGPGVTANAAGDVTVEVPDLGVKVYRADAPIPPSTSAPSISLTTPAEGAEVLGRVEVGATVGTSRYVEVTFAVAVDGGPYVPFGTDDNAPYRVFYDVSELTPGAILSFKAIVEDFSDNIASDKVNVVVGVEEPPVVGGFDYAVIHYNRPLGDYGDHTTGDFNDFWGLHLWGGAIDPSEVTDWPSPKPFLGQDEFGRFAWIKRGGDDSQINFIIHQGDTKDTPNDRFFNADSNPEIWINQGDETVYTSQADAQGFATIRYHRDDGDYGTPSPDYNTFWGLHLWGEAIDPSEGTTWTEPKPPTGIDDYGAFWEVQIVDSSQPVNFIIHRGDTKDPGPDESFIPAEIPTVWKQSGDLEIYPSRGAAEDVATIHYHRNDGDYGDNTSPDFNDFWGMHVWTGALNPNPLWTEPLRWSELDVFGPVFNIDLVDDAPELAYIIHRGDTKDPGLDQFLIFDPWGYEVWQLEGEGPTHPEPHYVLPILGAGAAPGDITSQQAYWVAEDTIAWAAGGDPGADYRLYYAPTGGMTLGDMDIEGGSFIGLSPGAPFPGGIDGYFHLAGMPTLKISSGDLALVPDILRGQITVQVTKDGGRLDATGLQIPGVLDDLYTYDGELGITWDGEVPTMRVWAPTAKSVTLHLFADSDPATTSTTTAMMLDPATGVWNITGDAVWKGKYYLYQVEVYVHSTGQVEHNLVTDPYSFSLAMNSTRSQIVDLNDSALKPAGWDETSKPPLVAPEDISIYEIHVRDFSVNDPTVPEELRGTYKAFTLAGTDGINHLQSLQAAGLTHLHLLPVFDIATINENKAEWQEADWSVLETYAPDSDQQQAAVTAVEDLDGFNWGYDPFHYTTPEGSYSTNPDGPTRIIEFREMVQAINEDSGLRVVMDVVYNHTNAAGQEEKSVLDRVVPGYYHRLDDTGQVETSTCCQNTASEHNMMEKLMIDSLVTWAKFYKIDAFRFDLMGHHSLANMLKVQAAMEEVDPDIYIYGEGWNFGEVADNARFIQATQFNLGGTGIGSFSDRLRDAVRGGSPFDGGNDLVRRQGFANGLFYDPNELNTSPEPEPEPASVTIAGSLQDELGCPGDWQADCAATHLTYYADDTAWQETFAIPAGSWEYKATLNDSWDENYGANAEANGPNIQLNLGAPTDVKFYYSRTTNWVTNNVNVVIATVPGSFQDEIGCPGDWQPDCLRSWLQDPEGDGIYSFSTSDIPPGSYEAKVTINESWDENYGAGGVQNGPNIPFSVEAGQTVIFNYDAVSHVLAITYATSDQLAQLLLLTDQIRVGMAGNLADYEFIDRNGLLVTGKDVDYNGQPAGYTQDPQEDITYISKHDNQTLYDNNTYKIPLEVSMADRVKIQNVGLSTVLLGQGVPFMHAGSDLLRSKSFDRDSFNSGDWFNKLDFSYQENNFGVGLPVAGKNQDNWYLMGPRLANPALNPGAGDIEQSAALFQELLAIRDSSPLFRLQTEADVQERVVFHNTGVGQLPGLIVMSIDDQDTAIELDGHYEAIVVLVNANDEAQAFTTADLVDQNLVLHPVQGNSVDALVQTSIYDPISGTFMVPGRTTAVFVLYEVPENLIGDLIDQIEDLVDQGVLNGGQGNSLIVKLEQALKQLGKGKTKQAINAMNAFINEVNSLFAEGVIPEEVAEQLLMEAEIIIAAIESHTFLPGLNSSFGSEWNLYEASKELFLPALGR